MNSPTAKHVSASLIAASFVLFLIAGYFAWKARSLVERAQQVEALSNQYLQGAQDEYRRALRRVEEVEEFYKREER